MYTCPIWVPQGEGKESPLKDTAPGCRSVLTNGPEGTATGADLSHARELRLNLQNTVFGFGAYRAFTRMALNPSL